MSMLIWNVFVVKNKCLADFSVGGKLKSLVGLKNYKSMGFLMKIFRYILINKLLSEIKSSQLFFIELWCFYAFWLIFSWILELLVGCWIFIIGLVGVF